MRIIKEAFLRDAAEQYPKAAKYLAAWAATVRAAAWRNMADVRGCYGSADVVHVRSRKPVIVFNVCGNTYRLVVAMHGRRHAIDYCISTQLLIWHQSRMIAVPSTACR